MTTKKSQNSQLGFYKKYREVIIYTIFGVLTTAVNIGTFLICDKLLHIANLPSNIIAWIACIAFAYVTNKIWVFNSKSWKFKVWTVELIKFISARLITLALDLGIMYLAVDVARMDSFIWKVISNVIVIVANYIISKLLVFREKQQVTTDKPKSKQKHGKA